MRKPFLLFLFITFIFSCKQKNKDTTAQETKPDTSKPVANPLPSFTSFLSSLDTTNVTSVSTAAQKYDQLFGKADTTQADSGYVRFAAFYDKIGSYLNDQLLKDPTDYSAYVFEDNPGKAPKTAAADAFVRKLRDNGFKLDLAEGSPYIKQDRNFLSKYFYPHVSSTMKQYLVQVNKENEEGFIDDAGLLITPTQLAERIVFWDPFIKSHPAFPFVEQLKDSQKGYLTFLLEGIDNTPLLDYTTNTLQSNFKEAFDNVLTNYASSSLASLIKPYYQALQAKDKRAAGKLLQQYRKQGLVYDYSS